MRRHLITITDKLEFMIIALGGQPDQTIQEGLLNMAKYEKISELIRINMRKINESISELRDVIKVQGYQNKDRILLDAKIKETFKESEDYMQELKKSFTKYIQSNRFKLA